jgi:hypothetical protein
MEAAGHRRPADARLHGQRSERRIRVCSAELAGFAHRRRQSLPLSGLRAQSLDGIELPDGGIDSSPEVGRLGVEASVDAGADVTDHAPLLK